jgi:hypothetical protein
LAALFIDFRENKYSKQALPGAENTETKSLRSHNNLRAILHIIGSRLFKKKKGLATIR